jgi:Putative cyclase
MTRNEGKFPPYAELLQRDDAPPGSCWWLHGADDELGSINFLTPDRVRAAAACIRRGEMFNLDCPLGAFDPPTSHQRKAARHTIFGNNPHHRDDVLDSFYLQAGTQLDSLRHMRHPIHGFYNGAAEESIAVGSPRNGISRWAEAGIAGRGVLIDLDRHCRRTSTALDHRAGEPIEVETIVAAAEAQRVEIRPGDILMLRTGWLRFYFDQLTAEERRMFPQRQCSAGLLQSHATLEWLWDNQIAVCAADNIGVEAIPPAPSSPFAAELTGVAGIGGGIVASLMHPHLIALLGVCLGELWDLDKLAEDCERDGVWESFVTVKPLNLIGGVGSPANALAIK